jgi:hypothetical protein
MAQAAGLLMRIEIIVNMFEVDCSHALHSLFFTVVQHFLV